MDNVLIRLGIIITIIISILKLTDVIEWSWWFILLPICVMFLIDFISYAVKEGKKSNKSGKKIDKFIEIKETRTKIQIELKNKK